jgi:protein-disulfide isomerase
MESTTTLAPGVLIDGRYELSARLGDGTFGEVWRAVDTRLSQRPVAVKVLKAEFLDRPDMVARFESEASALARVAHPNVVAVLDRGSYGAQRYIVTEMVEGKTLSAWLEDARRGGAPTGLITVRSLFDQVCAGVEAAHQVEVPGPIVHRDLKPDNVIVRSMQSGDSMVKVLDFGIAQLGARQGTRTGMLLGTPLYMAPEQAMGQIAGIAPWTDVFALAVILVEMLTLRANSMGEETWWATSLRTSGNVLPMLTAMRGDVPAAIWNVVAQALQPEGPRRFGNAGMFRAALKGAWESSATSSSFPHTVGMPGMAPPGSWAGAPSGGGTGTVVGTGTVATPVPQMMNQWGNPAPPQGFGPPGFPPPYRAPNVTPPGSSAFTAVVLGGLAFALVASLGAWAMLRPKPVTHPTEVVRQEPSAPVPDYNPPTEPARPSYPTRPSRPPEDPDRVYTIEVAPDAPSHGSRHAPVTMLYVSDFQCPFCARVAPTVARLEERYGERLRVVWMNYPLPFHQNAMPAAEAAMEAHAQQGDRGFWRMYETLFANQRALTADDLERYAQQQGLNLSRFRAAMRDHRHQATIRRDMSAITASGSSVGTPTFFINGRKLSGAQPFERFTAAIDRALGVASAE